MFTQLTTYFTEDFTHLNDGSLNKAIIRISQAKAARHASENTKEILRSNRRMSKRWTTNSV